MKNTFLFCLVLASLAAFAQMAPEEIIDDAPKEVDEAGEWKTYETDVDVSTGVNLTSPKIIHGQGIEITQDISHNKLFIHTINWPEFYPTRYIHKWNFHTKRGYAIKITFNKIFDVESTGKSNACISDYVEIDDYEDRFRFCSYNRPESYTSKSYHGFSMTFKSGGSGVGRGFFATVEQVPEVQPTMEMLDSYGHVITGKRVSVKAGHKTTIYCYVKNGIERAYKFHWNCKAKDSALVFESETTVSMSIEGSPYAYRSFPALTKVFKKGSKYQVCECKARVGGRSLIAKAQFHAK